MITPKISVVIPSYNKFKYINETLKSIFDQSYKNFEVIIQDAGSNDGALEVIQKYAKRYSNKVTYVSKKDNGQLDAINKGLKKVKGDIVTFINADDVYEMGAFESVVGHFIENPNSLWFAGRGAVINGKGEKIAGLVSWYKGFILNLNSYIFLLIVNYLMQPSVFLTSQAYKRYGPFNGNKDFVTEYDLWLKLGKVQMPVVINKNLSRFRIEPSTKTKVLSRKLIKEDEKVVRKYNHNVIVLMFHKIHNLVRLLYEKIY